MAHRLATTGMPDEGDAIHVDLPEERIVLVGIELTPRFEVFEQQPSTGIVLTANSTIDKVLVDGCQDESPAGKQFAQVAIPRVREVPHVVVSVYDQHEGKRSVAVGIPHPPVDGKIFRFEPPVRVPFLCPLAQADQL